MYIIFSRKDDKNSNYLKGINFRGYKFSRISRFFGKSAKCFVRFFVTRENFIPRIFLNFAIRENFIPWVSRSTIRSPFEGGGASQKPTSIDLISFSCLKANILGMCEGQKCMVWILRERTF